MAWCKRCTATRILLVSQVSEQYLTMLTYDELMAITRDTLKTAQDSYNLLKRRLDAGTAGRK